jgi:lipoate-protein ligase A
MTDVFYWHTDTQSHPSASENMAWDAALLTHRAPNQRIQRWYVWPHPGITYSYKQPCPPSLVHHDHAQRITGGGIVFHSPGDIVFTYIGATNDPLFPRSPKAKLAHVSQLIRDVLAPYIPLDASPSQSSSPNRDYCHSYPTPFELSVDGHKLLGITLRQFKPNWIIQGIIHTGPPHPHLLEAPAVPFQLPVTTLLPQLKQAVL